MPTKDSNVTTKIREWLENQGYPLEMRVARCFRDAGFHVIQAHLYADPETGTQREIDLVARFPEITGGLKLTFTVECKKSADKPWLLFSSPTTLEGRNVLFSYSVNSESAREILIDKFMDFGTGGQTLLDFPWVRKSGQIGYGITQAFTNGEDATFKASTGALKAAIAQKLETAEDSWSPFVFSFPVIVVDGPLFQCSLQDDGSVAIDQIENGELFFPLSIANEPGTCIHVVTAGSLSQFAADAAAVASTLHKYLEDDCTAKTRAI